jgi:hypothetical protein
MSADKDGGTSIWNEDGAGGDETELVSPVTGVGPTANAWSLDDVRDYSGTPTWSGDEALEKIVPSAEHRSWRHVGLIATLVVLASALVTLGVLVWSWPEKVTSTNGIAEVPTPPSAAAPSTKELPPCQYPEGQNTVACRLSAAPSTQECIHPNDVGCQTPLPAPTVPSFSGPYTVTQTAEIADGTPALTGKMMAVPCGQGCVDIVGMGGAAGTKTLRASLWAGKWEWDTTAEADCPDGSKSVNAGTVHFAIDATTLSGTATFTWNTGTCGYPGGNTNVNHVLFTKVN